MPSRPDKKIERRVDLRDCAVEMRDAGDGSGTQVPTFVGYAAVWNALSNDLGGFREIVREDAFDRSLSQVSDVRFLINHDSSQVLGRTKSGTLSLSKDERGLRVECPLPDTTYARDLQISMDRGDVDQMSFGFRAKQDAWKRTDEETGLPIRDLVDADLFDVSVVTFPAYPETSAEMRDDVFNVPEEVREAAAAAAEALADAPDDAAAPAAGDDPEEPAVVPVAQETVDDMLEAVRQLHEMAEQRVGKVLSQKNRATIGSAVETMSGAASTLQSLLDETQDADPAEVNSDEAFAELRMELQVPEGVDDAQVRDLLDQWVARHAPSVTLDSTARPNFIAWRKARLADEEQRDWDYDDDFQVYLLTQMIALGSSFMCSEEWESPAGDPDAVADAVDVSSMQAILSALAMLLDKEVSEPIKRLGPPEQNSDEPADEVRAAEALAEAEARRRRLELAERELELVVEP